MKEEELGKPYKTVLNEGLIGNDILSDTLN